MEYYFNNLNPTSFQRLVNGILLARYGEAARLTPLRGADGGRDAETAPGNPFFEYRVMDGAAKSSKSPISAGRYLFQVKHHRTLDIRPSDARALVIKDFVRELKTNVLGRSDDERVNYFFLITNVPASKDSIMEVDHKRREIIKEYPNLHADVWWQENVVGLLDQTPSLWSSFPEMFAGGKVPFLSDVVNKSSTGLSRAIRVAIGSQYQRDSLVKFKQIDLEKALTKLFVDLDVDLRFLNPHDAQFLVSEFLNRESGIVFETLESQDYYYSYVFRHKLPLVSALGVLLNDNHPSTRKILLEGGPGQGKSTITQMMTQIYRSEVLLRDDLNAEGRWLVPQKKRLPLRLELRTFAEWLGDHNEGSVEEYLAAILQKDSGGSPVTVDDIHNMVEHSPVLLVFDGLDEVGSADLRDGVLLAVTECVDRFESTLHSDLRVVVTTRPPAIAGRREQLASFSRFPIAPMEQKTINNYLDRWLTVQVHEQGERKEVRTSFDRRRNETHVKALVKNPMQLSVLLHFIRLKGEAFPDRRAELYRDYFRTVIDRDVEKTPELRQKRELIETLHELLGYKIHSLTEADKADGTLKRAQLLEIVRDWMRSQVSNPKSAADEIFRLGEERLGLIVALRGEAEEARYGYEIQPIREYFAAAYVNEQIQGNAHEVFQSLIYRPYWKEVALFLAGLRRPNEKADLITRAKEVDQSAEVAWRHDGRVIILQLLQEGVFSQPSHVFAEAVDFIVDLLDPRLVSIPNDPKDVLEVLPNLINQGETERHQQRILDIVENNRSNDDEQAIYRLYKVVSRILPPDRVRDLLLNYKGSQKDLLGKVRILWPSHWDIDMRTSASDAAFWQPLTDEVTATQVWSAAVNLDVATGIPLSDSLHSLLFERYAMSPVSIFERSLPDGISAMEPRSGWAIWRFVRLQHLLFSAALASKDTDPPTLDIENTENIPEYELRGLEQNVKDVVTSVTGATQELVRAIWKRSGALNEVLSSYISILTGCLSHGGLAGLIAARTGMYFLEFYRLAGRRRAQPGQNIFLDYLENQNTLGALCDGLVGYFEADRSELNDSVENAIGFVYQRVHEGRTLPTHLRVQNGGPFVDLTSLIVGNLCEGTQLPFPWLKEVPIRSGAIRSLVEKSGPCLENLLIMLSDRQFEPDNSARPLLVQNTQKILKLARLTKNSKVSEGALVALSASKFLNLAGPELTLKLIGSVVSKESVAQRLFLTRNQDSRVFAVLNESALRIVNKANDFPMGIRIAAANYLAEHVGIGQPPLLTLETELGLQIQVSQNEKLKPLI